MGVFMFGASWSGKDLSGSFIRKGVACVGWSQEDAPTLHDILERVRPGDLAVIKSWGGGLFRIRAVGLVTAVVAEVEDLGRGVKVRWGWVGDQAVPKKLMKDKYASARTITLYEEPSVRMAEFVVDLLLPAKKTKKTKKH